MITSEERAGHRSALTVAAWELWKRPEHWIAYTGLSVATMLALTGVFAASIAITSSQVLLCFLLAGLAIAHTEATRRIERQRRSMSVTPHINMTSVWVLPGAILLPPQLTALLVTVIYLHLGYRSWAGLHTVNPHRTVANATSMTLTAFAAWGPSRSSGPTRRR